MSGCALHSGLPPLALLAGGLATRLRPLTETVPKSLVLVDGEPFLAHQLRLLAEQGIRDIVICCGHLGDQIESFAGNGSRFGCRISYSQDGEKLLGTGGALRRALPLLGESFFVMYGDSYLIADPSHAWRAFLSEGKPALMTVFRNDGQWDASNVEMQDNAVLRYDKCVRTAVMGYIDYGLSLVSASVLEKWPDGEAFDLSTVFTGLAEAGQLAAHEVHTRFYEIGSPDGLRMTEDLIAGLRIAKPRELAAAGGER